jgi:hypothetical protein
MREKLWLEVGVNIAMHSDPAAVFFKSATAATAATAIRGKRQRYDRLRWPVGRGWIDGVNS